MAFTMTIDTSQLTKIFSKLKRIEKEVLIGKSLEQSGAHIEASHKSGFTKQKNPDGKNWKKLNPETYPHRPMADGVIRPFGDPPPNPTTSKSKALLNTDTMMTSLAFGLKNKTELNFGFSTREDARKAKNHHFGIASEAEFQFRKGGPITKKMIKPHVRELLGLAHWNRFGPFKDRKTILKIFEFNIQQGVERAFT